jgi:hypothetical protein
LLRAPQPLLHGGGIVLTPLMPLGVTVMGLLLAAIGIRLLTRPTPIGARAQPAGATLSIALP